MLLRIRRIRSVPIFVPTMCLFHGGPYIIIVQVNVPHRGAQIRVAREFLERERVHHLRPPRQAGMPQVVRNEY